MIEQYLERANEIIGERSKEEEKYDNEVVKWLRKQGNIRKALNKANQKYPDQALKYDDSNIDDLASHYEYLMQHMNMVKKLGS